MYCLLPLLLIALLITFIFAASSVPSAVSVAHNAGALPVHHPTNSRGRKLSLLPLSTCYDDALPLEASIPTLSSDISGAMLLTDARLSTSTNTVHHLRCREEKAKRPAFRWPTSYTKNEVKFIPTDNAGMLKLRQSCKNDSLPGLSIALERNAPLQHFGHRMLTDLPALWAVRTFLTDHGVDVSNVRVVYTDGMGYPAWGPGNFKPLLLSLGFKAYEPRGSSKGTTLCFEHVIMMPHVYYAKWYVPPGSSMMLNMWQAPEALYDTDPFHIKLLGHLRRVAFGLPARIPFAAAQNRTVVLASRDREIRKSAGFRLSRILENEPQLLKSLQSIPDINVQQVELGTMPMKDIVLLLQRTSLFLGYHGAGFDNLVFLPRGAAVLEILPKGTTHSPLYPALAHRTGKEFARYVNDDDARQTCGSKKKCLSHFADLTVNVEAVVKLVKSMLHTQQAAMTQYSFDNNV